MMTKPNLFVVVVDGVHPRQCVVVWEDRDNAQRLADHLNKTIRNVVTVEPTDSLFPAGMCEADDAWLIETASFIEQESKQ